MTRILIADDHEAMREGLIALLEREPGWEVCARAADGKEAVRLAREHAPDIAVLDLSMPEINGIEATRKIRRALPQTEVLIFSADHSEEMMAKAFEAGAKSYILKSDATRYLVEAIKSLLTHKPFFTSEVSDAVFSKYLTGKDECRSPVRRQKLTEREEQILRLVVEGFSNKEMAERMGISVRTVETHRANLHRALGVDSAAALVRYAIRNHLVEA